MSSFSSKNFLMWRDITLLSLSKRIDISSLDSQTMSSLGETYRKAEKQKWPYSKKVIFLQKKTDTTLSIVPVAIERQ